MKTQITLISLFVMLLLPRFSMAQTPNSSLAVISMDVQMKELRSQDITELVRIQLTKYGRYEMMDRYEIQEVLTKQGLTPENCYSRSCLLQAGKALKVDKVLSGSVDRLGETMYIRLRMLDVASGSVEKEISEQFLVLPEKITTMVTISLNDLLGEENDPTLVHSLNSKNSYESAVNNPHYDVMKLQGPRMGAAVFVGEGGRRMQRPRSEGGYDAFPIMFQFGYQFEKQYLTEGKTQCLVEFVPMISGLDQGMFIPSFTFMNGLRSNVNGMEIAIGPTFTFVKEGRFYYDANGNAQLADSKLPDNVETFKRLDSRGDVVLKSSVVIAAGFSFRSGRMNIPVNAYVVPSRNNLRFGVSFGFNAKG